MGLLDLMIGHVFVFVGRQFVLDFLEGEVMVGLERG
jgi:thiamine transporter ThiT